MALHIEFEGYVNETKTFDWGTVVKMSHQQRAKNAMTGEWETIGKDYIDVIPAEGVPIPDVNSIAAVTGTLKAGLYEKTDGGKGLSLQVRAQAISPVERKPKTDAVDLEEVW